MSVPVRIDFAPPAQDDVLALRIYEAPAAAGPWTQIERTTNIGAYPDYISHFTTQLATSQTGWFAIQWELAGGVLGPQSQGVLGGTGSLVARLVERVLQRDPTLDEGVVTQEAEGAIQMVFGDNTDPYDPNLTASYREMNGLAYLVLARSLIVRSIQTTVAGGNIDSATLGLVSFKSGAQTSSTQTVKQNVEGLIDLANQELGIATSLVMVTEDIDTAQYLTYDHSRLVSGWLAIE